MARESFYVIRSISFCTLFLSIMSKATKHKHVAKEVEEDLSIPSERQQIVRLIESRGNNLHEVLEASGEQILVSMPTKFRKSIWIKRGDYVLVEPIEEGDKVKAEIVKILTREHIKFYKSQNHWPEAFEKEPSLQKVVKNENEEDDDIFVNTNRLPRNHDNTDSESDSSSVASD